MHVRKQRLRRAKELATVTARNLPRKQQGSQLHLEPWAVLVLSLCVSPWGRTASQSKVRAASWEESPLTGIEKWEDGRSWLCIPSFGGSWRPCLPHWPSPFTSCSAAGQPPSPTPWDPHSPAGPWSWGRARTSQGPVWR